MDQEEWMEDIPQQRFLSQFYHWIVLGHHYKEDQDFTQTAMFLGLQSPLPHVNIELFYLEQCGGLKVGWGAFGDPSTECLAITDPILLLTFASLQHILIEHCGRGIHSEQDSVSTLRDRCHGRHLYIINRHLGCCEIIMECCGSPQEGASCYLCACFDYSQSHWGSLLLQLLVHLWHFKYESTFYGYCTSHCTQEKPNLLNGRMSLIAFQVVLLGGHLARLTLGQDSPTPQPVRKQASQQEVSSR